MATATGTTDRIVYCREDGKWANKRLDAHRPATVHDTQEEAVQAARRMLVHEGGGELIVKGEDGKIRSKDSIARSHERPDIPDTEH